MQGILHMILVLERHLRIIFVTLVSRSASYSSVSMTTSGLASLTSICVLFLSTFQGPCPSPWMLSTLTCTRIPHTSHSSDWPSENFHREYYFFVVAIYKSIACQHTHAPAIFRRTRSAYLGTPGVRQSREGHEAEVAVTTTRVAIIVIYVKGVQAGRFRVPFARFPRSFSWIIQVLLFIRWRFCRYL